jgi:endonuclease/exonuclease/phosphatase family metal-dependent hydrolase
MPPPDPPAAEAPAITDRPPPEVAADLTALGGALDAAVPPKRVDRNLLIGTWNIRHFGDVTKKWRSAEGDQPKRDLGALRCIAEIVSRFDVVAVQEVRENIASLRHMLRLLGEDWAMILTDVTKGSAGNNERLAFVFDTRRVKPSGLACELVLPDEWAERVGDDVFARQFARTPYAVSFRSGGQTFILVTLHVLYGDSSAGREHELRWLAKWMAAWADRVHEYRQNLIVLGDFNIDRKDDPNWQAFTSTGLRPPPELDGLTRTIFDDPAAPNRAKHFDQIAWFHEGEASKLELDYSGRAGRFDFVPVVLTGLTKTELSWRLSDHYPLWAEFQMRPR